MGERLRVAVVGDTAVDWFAEVVPQHVWESVDDDQVENWQRRDGLRLHREAGGACLLARMVEAGLGYVEVDSDIRSYNDKDLLALVPEHAINSYADVATYHRDGRRVRLVERFRGFAAQPVAPATLPVDDGPVDVLIVDDAGNRFRRLPPDQLPACVRAPGNARLVIVKMSSPLASGAVWNALKPSGANTSALRILVVSAEDLRARGLDISRRLSWERSAVDLCRLLASAKRGDLLSELASFGHLVVRFGLEGAALISTTEDGPRVQLAFDPGAAEDGFSRSLPGRMAGRASAFVAAMAASLAADIPRQQPAVARELEDRFRRAIEDGLHRARLLAAHGLAERDGRLVYPVSEVFADRQSGRPTIGWWPLPPLVGAARDITILYSEIETTAATGTPYAIARQVAIHGESRLDRLPTARFGKLLLADRKSIEAYRSVANLFEEYLARPNDHRPLSIAVFGSPGAGKSFGVKEIGRHIAADKIVPCIFNLAEFVDTRGLVGAFQAARDVSLKGKVPLVLFDEFDTDLDGRALGWLKFFLAPMQDGEFNEDRHIHPLGRAIFIFAGGTAHSYGAFARTSDGVGGDGRADLEDPTRRRSLDFKALKGPDFVSRLRGHVDIPGLNPDDGRRETDDKSYLVRRALLLRGFLKHKAPRLFRGVDQTLAIDGPVLDAFLCAERYVHGARSMEAIIDMSLLANRSQFEMSSLPPDWQLRPHVDESFSRWVAASV